MKILGSWEPHLSKAEQVVVLAMGVPADTDREDLKQHRLGHENLTDFRQHCLDLPSLIKICFAFCCPHKQHLVVRAWFRAMVPVAGVAGVAGSGMFLFLHGKVGTKQKDERGSLLRKSFFNWNKVIETKYGPRTMSFQKMKVS